MIRHVFNLLDVVDTLEKMNMVMKEISEIHHTMMGSHISQHPLGRHLSDKEMEEMVNRPNAIFVS